MVDEKGRTIDGDQLMALIAQAWAKDGKLKGGHVVATVMSNLGFERFLKENGIGLIRTPVGDRYVVERCVSAAAISAASNRGIWSCRITAPRATAFGGVADSCCYQGKSRSCESGLPPVFAGAAAFEKRAHQRDVMNDPTFQGAIKAAETKLNGGGRLVVRKSGTEALIRVMAEGDDEQLVAEIVDDLIARAVA